MLTPELFKLAGPNNRNMEAKIKVVGVFKVTFSLTFLMQKKKKAAISIATVPPPPAFLGTVQESRTNSNARCLHFRVLYEAVADTGNFPFFSG